MTKLSSISPAFPALALIGTPTRSLMSQEPASWSANLEFNTFSIAAVDPVTKESGVAVTTHVTCVGNGVPWVRPGVGAVATQATTRTEYGPRLLDQIATKVAQADALSRLNATEKRERFGRKLLDVTAVRR